MREGNNEGSHGSCGVMMVLLMVVVLVLITAVMKVVINMSCYS